MNLENTYQLHRHYHWDHKTKVDCALMLLSLQGVLVQYTQQLQLCNNVIYYSKDYGINISALPEINVLFACIIFVLKKTNFFFILTSYTSATAIISISIGMGLKNFNS